MVGKLAPNFVQIGIFLRNYLKIVENSPKFGTFYVLKKIIQKIYFTTDRLNISEITLEGNSTIIFLFALYMGLRWVVFNTSKSGKIIHTQIQNTHKTTFESWRWGFRLRDKDCSLYLKKQFCATFHHTFFPQNTPNVGQIAHFLRPPPHGPECNYNAKKTKKRNKNLDIYLNFI